MIVVDALPAHGEDFLKRPIRQADVDEWVAGTARPVRLHLPEVWKTPGSHPRALLNEDGGCICLWGITEAPGDLGYVWLIATIEAAKRARVIHRLWREEVAWLHSHRRVLHAYAYSQNVVHHRWLEAVGFVRTGQETRAYPYAPPFYLYARTSDVR